MSTKELKLQLLQALQPPLQDNGFKLQKSKEQFTRTKAGVKQHFVLDFTIYEHLHVKPAINLRVDSVEEIFHRSSGFEKQYQADTPTLSTSLQNLSGDTSKYEYVIRGVDDVYVIASQLERDFCEIVLPYLQRYSELRAVDEALNSDPEHDSVHYMMDYLRCAHGVIVACMIERPDYNDLVDLYRRRLALVSGGFYLPRFEALIADLACQVTRHASSR